MTVSRGCRGMICKLRLVISPFRVAEGKTGGKGAFDGDERGRETFGRVDFKYLWCACEAAK